jgi:catechol 2,3-dioxygenase-like lactoylglutathione lyase family enzyme
MKIERLERVGVNVKNLDEAIKLFSRVLGTTFFKAQVENLERTFTEHAGRAYKETKITKVAMDRTGFLELLESTPPVAKEGLDNIHFKVPNLKQAKAEMKREGIRLVEEIEGPHFKEAVFHSDDLCGVTLCLVEYDANDMLDIAEPA